MCQRPPKRRRIEEINSLKFTFMPLLEEVNAHPKDKFIQFQDEGHKYWIRGKNKNVISTTTLIKKYFGDFDRDGIVDRIMANKRYFKDPEYKYYRLRKSEILAMWSEAGRKAAEEGTYNHLQLEYFHNGQIADFSKYEHNTLFRGYWKDHMTYLEPFRTEMLLFHEKLKITGSADIIYKNKRTGKLVLGDYKFIKKLTKKCKGKQALAPIDHIDDCNYSKYALQLSIYRYILETEYGYEVENQFLIILHKNQKKYKKVEAPYLKAEVQSIFQEREESLRKLEISEEQCL